MLTRSSRHPDGSRCSRRALLTGVGATLAVVTAGCTGFLDDEETASGDPESHVPAETTVLARLDVATIAADGNDDVLEELAAVEPGHIDVATTFEARTGLDPLEADELLLFDADAADTDDDTTGRNVIVDGDWAEADVVASLEETTGLEYERSEVDELYRPVDATEVDSDAPEPPFLGVLIDDRFVVGEEEGVRSSLDVRDGDGEPLAGTLRDAYDDARGEHLTVASEPSGPLVPAEYQALADGLNFEIFDEVQAVGRSYAAVENGIAIELALHVPTEADAAELESVTNGAIAALAGLDEEFADARDDVSLERTGAVVELDYEGDADVVFALLDEV
ncbi:hypothetical protein GS429_17925 [Natronorubrum sp. JWXQ-INN-674]|uniref:Uncharacterized protein n=1 Tax=Natronorubrum halalkaliphilum TaxID=2691917 RepID=A0A6B0VQZ8_9EURY|nr:hypothetical protein [Natronorubrum halalkaliphilum]MXV63904.1 hypothetical protein [Natronorubrum halalkaliphilum]